MEFLIAPLLLIGLVLFVALPVLRESTDSLDIEELTLLDGAIEEKDNAIANLKDIEMDFRMGKLSQEDYDRLRGEWEDRAVNALQKVDSIQKSKGSSRKSA